MLSKVLYDAGLRGWLLHGASVSAIALCIALWIRDRKSTRLNSSHANISYAVFCLKKTTDRLPPWGSHPLAVRHAPAPAISGALLLRSVARGSDGGGHSIPRGRPPAAALGSCHALR